MSWEKDECAQCHNKVTKGLIRCSWCGALMEASKMFKSRMCTKYGPRRTFNMYQTVYNRIEAQERYEESNSLAKLDREDIRACRNDDYFRGGSVYNRNEQMLLDAVERMQAAGFITMQSDPNQKYPLAPLNMNTVGKPVSSFIPMGQVVDRILSLLADCNYPAVLEARLLRCRELPPLVATFWSKKDYHQAIWASCDMLALTLESCDMKNDSNPSEEFHQMFCMARLVLSQFYSWNDLCLAVYSVFKESDPHSKDKHYASTKASLIFEKLAITSKSWLGGVLASRGLSLQEIKEQLNAPKITRRVRDLSFVHNKG